MSGKTGRNVGSGRQIYYNNYKITKIWN
jgi:hypothetical protein